jgi:hypothetical protein
VSPGFRGAGFPEDLPGFFLLTRGRVRQACDLTPVKEPELAPAVMINSPANGGKVRPGKAELDAMVAQATIDCYDEEEQLTGLATMIEDNLEVPFTTTVLGLAVTVRGVIHASHGLVADCVHGRHVQAIHVLDLSTPDPSPKGAERIAAYLHWAR